jgi:hypothetical protein
MIGRVVDGLDQDEDARDIIELSLISKMQYLASIELLCDRDQSFTTLTRSPPQFIEAWKGIVFMEHRLRPLSGESLHVAFLGGNDMHQGLPCTAKRSSDGSIELRVVETRASVEHTQVRPEVILEKVRDYFSHIDKPPLLKKPTDTGMSQVSQLSQAELKDRENPRVP